MKKIVCAIALASAFGVKAADDHSADDQSVKVPAKIALCVACHGQQGNSTNPLWPNIAGQHELYLEKQLFDFKKVTKRNAPIMTAITATLTDQDIKELSAYYAALPLAKGFTPKNI